MLKNNNKILMNLQQLKREGGLNDLDTKDCKDAVDLFNVYTKQEKETDALMYLYLLSKSLDDLREEKKKHQEDVSELNRKLLEVELNNKNIKLKNKTLTLENESIKEETEEVIKERALRNKLVSLGFKTEDSKIIQLYLEGLSYRDIEKQISGSRGKIYRVINKYKNLV